MRVFTRLALLGGILSALLLVAGGMGLYGLAATNEALRTVYEDRTVPAGQLGEIGAKLISNQLALTDKPFNRLKASIAPLIGHHPCAKIFVILTTA